MIKYSSCNTSTSTMRESADSKIISTLPEQPKTEAMPSNTDSVLQFLNKQDSVNDVKTEMAALPRTRV